jgi:hypothetical protein
VFALAGSFIGRNLLYEKVLRPLLDDPADACEFFREVWEPHPSFVARVFNPCLWLRIPDTG